jgi:hypothetical protein
MMLSPPIRSRVAQLCLVVLLGLMMGVLVAEAASRFLETRLCHSTPGPFWQPNLFYGWGHIPRASGVAQSCLHGTAEWRVPTTINRHGLRDREIPYERQTDTVRILVLGDSFAEGMQVDQQATFAKVIESRLADLGRAVGHRFEVINAGVSAFGTDNELLFFRKEGWKYHPDVVLLEFFTGNDVLENSAELLHASAFPYPPKPHFLLSGERLLLVDFPLPPESFSETAIRRAAHVSSLVRRFATLPLERGALERSPFEDPSVKIYLTEEPEEWRLAWRITGDLLVKLAREVEARGSRFAVAIVNDKAEVLPRVLKARIGAHSRLRGASFDWEKPNRRVLNLLHDHGILAVPLLDAFRVRAADAAAPALFYAWDMHWTPAGHELAAETVRAALEPMLGEVASLQPPTARASPR